MKPRQKYGFVLSLVWIILMMTIVLYVSLTDGGFESASGPVMIALAFELVCLFTVWRLPRTWPIGLIGVVAVFASMEPGVLGLFSRPRDAVSSLLLISPVLIGSILMRPSGNTSKALLVR